MSNPEENKMPPGCAGTSDTHGSAAAGKLEVVTTYLEMKKRPRRLFDRPPIEGVRVIRAQRPAVSFYRYLYNCVGEPWLWHIRRKIDDEALCAIIHDENVEVYVLYVSGVPAGYVELDRRNNDNVELAYFGLMPEFIGRGLGPYLLDWGLSQAWRKQPRRVWVHTCSLDHPKAIEVYQRAGFIPYKRETTLVDDPRLDESGKWQVTNSKKGI